MLAGWCLNGLMSAGVNNMDYIHPRDPSRTPTRIDTAFDNASADGELVKAAQRHAEITLIKLRGELFAMLANVSDQGAVIDCVESFDDKAVCAIDDYFTALYKEVTDESKVYDQFVRERK